MQKVTYGTLTHSSRLLRWRLRQPHFQVGLHMSGKRDNDYYLQRLKRGWPDLFREVQDGHISVAAARRRAGLGGARTRLHELKNAWNHATASERVAFLKWAKASISPPVAPALVAPPPTAWSAEGRLTERAKRRIEEVMDRRGLLAGTLADELGINRLDASVSRALSRNSKVHTATTREAVDRWLNANEGV